MLITLGIIGVVAAMTMPTLINQTNGAQYRAAYKKALSAISQGVTLNVALDDISFADTVAATAGGSSATAKNGTNTTIGSLIASRMNVVKADGTQSFLPNENVSIKYKHICTETEAGTGEGKIDACSGQSGKSIEITGTVNPSSLDTALFFNDSSMFAYNYADEKCTPSNMCYGIIDVNGAKGPNKVTKCDSTTGTCVVTSPTDIYPVVFYDQTILPANDAASAVLYGK